MAVLQQIDNGRRGHLFHLGTEPVTVGRDASCELNVASPAVSRVHARIFLRDSKYYIEDLQSRNGTNLNGRRIGGPEPLKNGDQLEFSTQQFVFYSELSLDDQLNSSGFHHASEIVQGRHVELDSDDVSIRHVNVRQGDCISLTDSGVDDFQESKVVAMLPVSSLQLAPAATADAARKLLQAIRLLHSLRQVASAADMLSVTIDRLFTFFPAAQRAVIVDRPPKSSGFRVLTAAGRENDRSVPLCPPLIARVWEKVAAILYVDQWRIAPQQEQPKLSDMSTRYVLCVPMLRTDDSCCGVIQLESGGPDRPLDSGDLERLVILSQFITFALEWSGICDSTPLVLERVTEYPDDESTPAGSRGTANSAEHRLDDLGDRHV